MKQTELKRIAEEIKGMKEEEAVKKLNEHDIRNRIVYRDGEHYMVTTDYDTSRINLHIENGKVDKYSFG